MLKATTRVNYMFYHTCISETSFLHREHCALMASVLFYFIKLLVVTHELDFKMWS